MDNVRIDNEAHVRAIVEDLYAVADGRAYIDSDGVLATVEDYSDVPEDAEPASMLDYFGDLLDIDFIVTSELEYKAARICIAWGGPSIYVDTRALEVQFYWWNEYASATFARYVGDCIDEFASELYELKRC